MAMATNVLGLVYKSKEIENFFISLNHSDFKGN